MTVPNPDPITTLEHVRARGRLVCGVLGSFEPYSFRQPDDGAIVGYEPDFGRALADYLGVTFEPLLVTAAERHACLLDGRADVMAALLSRTAERDAVMDFSGIYSKDVNQLMVRAEAGFVHADELARQRIGALAGTSLPQVARTRYPQAALHLFAEPQDACHALLADQVDAIFIRTTSLIALQRKFSGLAILPEVLLAPETAFAVRKGDDALRLEINRFLDQAEADGSAQRIFDRWLGSGSSFGMVRNFRVGAPPGRG